MEDKLSLSLEKILKKTDTSTGVKIENQDPATNLVGGTSIYN